MIQFRILLIIYSSIIFFVSFILLRYAFAIEVYVKEDKSKLKFKWMIVLLFLILLPRILHMIYYYGSFASPDSYAHIRYSHLIILEGSVLKSDLINYYYISFPIFSLMIAMISIVTSLHPLYSYTLFHVLSLGLISSCITLLLILIGARKDNFTPLTGALLLVGSIYLYGYFDTFVPNLVSVLALSMMLIATFKRANTLLLLFSVFGLVHITTIPIYVAIALVFISIRKLTIRGSDEKGMLDRKITISLIRTIIFPLAIWLSYLVYSYARLSLRGALLSFSTYWKRVATEASISFVDGNARPLAIINAIGPSLIIGSTAAYAMFFLYFAIARHFKFSEQDTRLASISLVSILLLGVSSLWQFIRIAVPYGSPGWTRYLGIPAFFLSIVTSTLTLKKIFTLHRMGKLYIRLLSSMFLFLLIVGAIGGLMDPFTFKTSNNSFLLSVSQNTRLDKEAVFLVKYTSVNTELNLIGETSTLSYIVNDIYYLNNSLSIKTLRTGLKGGVYYKDIELIEFLENPSRYNNALVVVTIGDKYIEESLTYFNTVYHDGEYYILTS